MTDPAVGGAFSSPFAEPGPACPNETNGSNAQDTRKDIACKPAAVSVVVLPGGKLLYWDGLEGEEGSTYRGRARSARPPATTRAACWTSVGNSASSGQARAARRRRRRVGRQRVPRAQRSRRARQAISTARARAGCAVLLRPGAPVQRRRSSSPAGPTTTRSRTPGHRPTGVAELQGLRNTRDLRPAHEHVVRRPANELRPLVPEPGHAGRRQGVRRQRRHQAAQARLHRPPAGLGHERRADRDLRPAHRASGPTTARARTRSLPLYPRLHLLPDGKVYYDAGGQTFNPMGQSYDEALWNGPPSTTRRRKLADVGVPLGARPSRSAAGHSLSAGFRGSTFSIMLPLRAAATPRRRSCPPAACSAPRPGTYLANTSSVDQHGRHRGGDDEFTLAGDRRRSTTRAGSRPACCCRPAR